MARAPSDPLDRAAASHQRAVEHLAAGAPRRARPFAERALALFRRHAGPRHPDVGSALDTLAVIDAARGDAAAARRRLRQALAILEGYPREPAVRPLLAQSLRHLGALLREDGRYPAAAPLLRRAARVTARAWGPDSLEHADALNELGVLCKHAGSFAAGVRAYTRALAIAEAHPEGEALVATLLHNLGGIEHARGRFAEAEAYARRGRALQAAALGDDHPRVLLDDGALAPILEGLGRFAEAEAIYRRLLPRLEASYGRGHYEVAVVCHNLAAALAATDRAEEADALYRRAVAIKRARLGPSHPDLAITLHNLAALDAARGRERQARRHARRALAVARTGLGDLHPTAVASRDLLAKLGPPTPRR